MQTVRDWFQVVLLLVICLHSRKVKLGRLRYRLSVTSAINIALITSLASTWRRPRGLGVLGRWLSGTPIFNSAEGRASRNRVWLRGLHIGEDATLSYAEKCQSSYYLVRYCHK